MEYTATEIDKVLNKKSWSPEKKIDELLHKDCNMYANLGSDSSKKDKEEVKKVSRKIYNAIKSLDHNQGTLFLQAMDDK